MASINEQLREQARKLLADKVVDLIIGYRKGSLPLRSTPYLVKTEEEAGSLIFDLTSSNNLAKYLPRVKTENRGSKIGIVCKGCDGRSVVQLIIEGQVKREDIVIIGVPCEGVVDTRKVRKKTGGEEVLRVSLPVLPGSGGREIMVEGRGFKITLDKEEVLCDVCLGCQHPNPPLYDLFIGRPREGSSARDEFKALEEFERLSSDERWRYFEHEASRCIRCYACRDACPLCYCEQCFVDETHPQWFGKGPDSSDTLIFHIVRALHTAGRCVSCGACVRACPVGINLNPLWVRIEKEVKERFGYTAGLSLEVTPPLATYDENDKQEFIL